MPKYSFPIQSAFTEESPDEQRKRNLDWAKGALLEGGNFSASLWVYTDGKGKEPQNTYYVVTNPEIVKDTKESPMDQITPLVTMFRGKEDEFGKVLAYQVVSEVWVKSFAKTGENPPIEWGDMAKMANREEVFIEQYVRPGYDVESQVFEIIHDEDSDDVKELRYMEDMSRMIQTKKLLPLPMEGKRNE